MIVSNKDFGEFMNKLDELNLDGCVFDNEEIVRLLEEKVDFSMDEEFSKV